MGSRGQRVSSRSPDLAPACWRYKHIHDLHWAEPTHTTAGVDLVARRTPARLAHGPLASTTRYRWPFLSHEIWNKPGHPNETKAFPGRQAHPAACQTPLSGRRPGGAARRGAAAHAGHHPVNTQPPAGHHSVITQRRSRQPVITQSSLNRQPVITQSSLSGAANSPLTTEW